MICGRYEQPASACFDEIDTAVRLMTDRVVAFNAHRYSAPKGAIIFNTENIPDQVPDWKERFAGHELWDISAKNCAITGAKHVAVGYHPSMERFKRAPVPDIDVVFTGSINERRAKIIDALLARKLNVVCIGPGESYGAERDAILARARVVINPLFYPDGIFPVLRVAHCTANMVPILSETCADVRGYSCPYDQIVDDTAALVYRSDLRNRVAENAYASLKASPMVLPS